MRIAKSITATALAALIAATPALAATPADNAANQVHLLLAHSPALQADLLQVQIQDQTVYIRGTVDTEVEHRLIDQLISDIGTVAVVNSTTVASGL